MNRRKKTVISLLLHLILIAGSFAMLLPFAWMIVSSLKEAKDVFQIPMQWIPDHWKFSNYKTVFERIPFAKYFMNSFKVAGIGMLVQIFTSTFAAYGFTWTDFPGKKALYLAYIVTLAVPWHAYMVPQFVIVRKMGLTDSHMGLVLLLSFTAFGVFLVKQFYLSIPNELCEAARVDGMNEYLIYGKIVLPLSKPVISTLAIFSFVSIWNDYVANMIYISSDSKKSLQMGLKVFIGLYSADYSLIMAGCVIALIPVTILFLFLQKYLIEGVATSGLKG